MTDPLDAVLDNSNQGAADPAAPGTDIGNRTPYPGIRPLYELRKWLDDYRSITDTNNTQGAIDYDYYDGKQLTPTERAALKLRGQPDIVVNRMKVAVNGILGVMASSHTDPKAWPRAQDDNDAADVATEVLRYVAEKERFNRKRVECFKDNLLGGTCAMFIGGSDKSVPMSQVRWEEFFYDPRSRKVDFSDARYKGIMKWKYIDEVQDSYPGTSIDFTSDMGSTGGSLFMMGETQQDRPIAQGWLDDKYRRVMIVEMYYKHKNQWIKVVFWYGGILEEGPSPFLDEYGNKICPIEAVSCYVDRDNNRYGIARDMRDLQDEINKRRSKLLHLVNSSQIQARDPSAIEVDANVARKEAARPDGVLPFGWQKVPTQDMAQGQSLLLTEAKSEMERFGPNPAVLGRQGADTSGRALLARQQAGMIELAVPLDQMEDWELRCYKAVWLRVKQFWKAPQFIRVTGNPDDPQFVGINQPIPNPQAGQPVMAPHPEGLTQDAGDGTQVVQQVPVMQQMVDENQQPVEDPQNPGQPMLRPKIHPDILGYKNNVAEMDVDIVIDSTPATATIMQEMFQDLMKLVSSNPAYAQQVPFETFLQLMPIPRKRQIIAEIKQYKATMQQGQQEQAQQQMQAMMTKLMAEVKEMISKARLNDAKTDQVHSEIVGGAIDTSVAAHSALNETLQNQEDAEAPQGDAE